MNLEDKIRYERESTALDFKLEQYKKPQYFSFVKDVLAMANANVTGSRFVIIGVEEKGEKREIVGLKEKMDDAAIFQQIIHEYIEPDIELSYEPFEMDGMTFGVFEISNCTNQPYMMKKDYNYPGKDAVALKKGDILIRKGSTQMRASRRDLDVMYAQQSEDHILKEQFDIVFKQSETKEFTFNIPHTYIPPSAIKKHQIKKILANRSPTPKLSNEEKEFHLYSGYSFSSYEELDNIQLENELESIESSNREEDLYYFFKEFGTEMNFFMHNKGTRYIDDATVRIYIPQIEGIKVLKTFPPRPHSGIEIFNRSERYADVFVKDGSFIISTDFGNIKHHVPLVLFDKPPMIAVRETLAGKAIPLRFEITARNLPKPIFKDLSITADFKKNPLPTA